MAIFSCKEKFKPIPTSTLRNMLVEMHLAEAYLQHVQIDSIYTENTKRDSLQFFYAKILSQNKYTEAQFTESMKWYSQRPKDLDSLYSDVLTEFSLLQAKFSTKKMK
jgi:hypothetical protein